jgi:predicted RND superfamily exporter protein
LLSIGIIFTLVCSLVVLPALIKPAVYSRIRNEPP